MNSLKNVTDRLILTIDIVSPTTEVGLIQSLSTSSQKTEMEVIGKMSWENIMHSTEMLLPTIHKLLTENNYSVHDLTDVVLVNGPGSFVAIRAAVIIVSSLQSYINCRVYALNTFDFLSAITSMNNINCETIYLFAGGRDVYEYDTADTTCSIVNIPEWLDIDETGYVDLEEANICNSLFLMKKTYNFKSTFLDVVQWLLKNDILHKFATEAVEPFYGKEPSITLPPGRLK